MSVEPAEGSQLPPAELRARLNKGFGCLSIIATALGAGAGAFVAWNVRPMIEAGVAAGAFIGGGAIIGAIVTLLVFRRRFAAMAKVK